MKDSKKNFIYNRRLTLKSSAKYAFFILNILIGMVFPWQNSTLAEKIIIGCMLWIEMCVILFYATNERMKSQRKRNACYGWSIYYSSWLLLYCNYRISFLQYHWLVWCYLGYGILQTILWILGVRENIRRNKYSEIVPKKPTINIFTAFTTMVFVLFVVMVCITMFGCKISTILCMAVVCFLFVHVFFLLSLTFIYQWAIMKINGVDIVEQ